MDSLDQLDLLFDEGARAWPSLALDRATFRAHVTARAPEADLARAADVFLACACAGGDPTALAAFEVAHLADLRAVYGQVRGARPPLDEFVQIMRHKLFVGERPKIAEYGGTGELKSWVRVTGARTLVDLARQGRHSESPLEDGVSRALVAPDDDPELEYMKRTYHAETRRAFEDAAQGLAPEARNVLRDHYAQGLGIDQIASIHGIHRATAARRLASAREAILRDTRQLLMQRLNVSRAELESVVRLIESQMHVTMERILREA
jgi:RNA polymerase sigma-70 factor (ECF subfamily)